MKCFRLGSGWPLVARATLTVALIGCAPLQTRHAPPSAPPAGSAQSAGAQTFRKWCGDCHGTAQGPGSMALQRRYQGSLPAVLEQRNDLPPEFVALAVRHGVSFMPSFRKTEISDGDLLLLTDYLAKRP